ncbi:MULTISPECIES: alpha/beta hydrolase family protein [Hyphobacterium]|uniref:Alpha/beta hydrolase family protein n=1 Tax=Hyphobacterium vulgare TaxID=1736751 RepID=A0ABV6ZYF0_9PROT
MSSRTIAALAALTIHGIAAAQDGPPLDASLEPFATLPALQSVEVSPSGQRLASMCSGGELPTLCVYDLTGGSAPFALEPWRDGEIVDYFWARDRYLVFTVRSYESFRGSEVYYSRSVAFDVETRNGVQLLNNFGQIYSSLFASMNIDTPDTIIMEIRTGNGLERFDVSLADGEGRSIHRARDHITYDVLDPEGEIVAEQYININQSLYEVRRPGTRRDPFYSGRHLSDRPDILGFIDGGSALAMVFSEGPNRGLQRLDLEAGGVTAVAIPGLPSGMVYAPIIDRHHNELVGVGLSNDDLPDQIFIDEELAGIQAALLGALGTERVNLESWSSDRSIVVASAFSRGVPEVFYVFNTVSGEVSVLGEAYPGLANRPTGEVISLSYDAGDGLSIPALLTLPPGMNQDDGPFTLIVLPHGGPQLRDYATFDWMAQAYASLGYAVLQPNFRGSAGYGQDFVAAGYGEFGRRMVTDSIEGAQILVREGLARPGYCIVGASYGGYASLMAGILDPENVRCVIAINAVSDPHAMLGDNYASGRLIGLDYWERYIGSLYMDRDNRRAIAPVLRAGEIRAPLLLMHGANDLTVPVEQSRGIERVMRDSPLLTYREIESQDHYLSTGSSRARVLAETAAFLAEHYPVE